MRLSEKIQEYQVARDLFPLCLKCGRDLSKDRLMSLRIAVSQPNRFVCGTCPEEPPSLPAFAYTRPSLRPSHAMYTRHTPDKFAKARADMARHQKGGRPRKQANFMSEIRITVPMPPKATNRTTGNHWRTVYREKQAYADHLDVLQAAGRIPAPPSSPFAKARIASTMHLGGAMDDDNAMARHKPLLDWLKTRGYITDDRKRCLSWDALPEQIVKRDGNYRIDLVLREAA